VGSSFTLEKAAAAYRIPIIDYERDAPGCLISAGSGIGLAVMDMEASLFRYLVDTDQLGKNARLTDFVICAQRLAPPIAFVGVHLANQRLMADAALVTAAPFYSLIGHIDRAGPRQVYSLEGLHEELARH
jgi:hypothetical protein